MDRRGFLAVGATVGLGSLSGCLIRSSRESETGNGDKVRIQPAVDGLDFPTAIAPEPGGQHLVSEREGRLLRSGVAGGHDVILDISDRIADISGEVGLLNVETHPEYERNGKAYLRYSAPLRERMDSGRYTHTFVLSEFEVTAESQQAIRESERTVMELPQPGTKHNGGGLAFSKEGYLYVGVGDGASYTEPSTPPVVDESWWYERGEASQNTETNLYGGVLRIDVDNNGDDGYTTPPENPLVGRSGRDEYYAWGFRNPWSISVDGDRLFVGDVGAVNREEINLVEKGGNYGWPVLEGSTCAPSVSLKTLIERNVVNVFNPKAWASTFNLLSPYKVCPGRSDGGSFRDPVIEYSRAGTRAVIGGNVYRGDDVPELREQYIFGDWALPSAVYATDLESGETPPWTVRELSVENTGNQKVPGSIISIERDSAGELYLVTTRYQEGTGTVYKLTSADS